ncbi:MAG: tetratricopeptide repeat protein [Burkholderiaceae bacterium]|nr:tetratricopeptide repeat protein [Burkholderiaceae bacterium]
MTKASFPVLGFGALLIAAVLCIYLPGLHNELVFDDMRLKDGTIFGSYGSLLAFKPRMLSYGSFVWVQSLLGEGWWKQRLVNLALHAGTVAALYALMRDLLAQVRFPEDFKSSGHFEASRQAALLLGIGLFAVNPVAVYAVGYLVQRSIVMATLFVVLACGSYLRGLLTGKIHWYVLALLSYGAAVLSKEHALLAIAMAVPLYIQVKRPPLKSIAIGGALSLLVLGAVATVFLITFGNLLGTTFDARSVEFTQQLEALSPGITPWMYPLSVLNEAMLFFAYGFLWFFPNVTVMSLDLRPAFPLGFFSFPHVLGGLGYIALAGTSIALFLKGRGVLSFVGLCLLFPLLLFFSEFATVWVQDPFVLYRSYLWAIAVPGLVAVLLTGSKPRTIYVLGGLLVAVFATLAWERTLSLRDPLTAWGDAAAKIDLKAPANAVGRWQAFLNLGGYHIEMGSLGEAKKESATAEALGESKGYALFNMGVAYQREKNHAQALAFFARAEAKGFTDGLVQFHKGESLFALGRFGEAYQSLSKAVESSAGIASAATENVATMVHQRALRAEAAIAVQQYDVAIADFNLLLQDAPRAERLLIGLGTAKVGKGDTAAALAIFDQVIAVHPSAPAFYGRAMAYFKSGDKAASLKDLDQTIALDPRNPRYAQIRSQIASDKLVR